MLSQSFFFLIVIFTVLIVRLLEHQKSSGIKKILQWIPPILFAYIIPALVCLVIGVDLSGTEIHQWSKEYMPLAIVTIMSSCH